MATVEAADKKTAAKMRRLWPLLLKDLKDLTAREIDKLLELKWELTDHLHWCTSHFPRLFEEARSKRKRKTTPPKAA